MDKPLLGDPPPDTPRSERRGQSAVAAERRRLADAETGSGSRASEWRAWGPYVAERAWGTVREDYSADGDAWASFPFQHAASRTYRWNEDGLSAWCDSQQRLCFGIALWNGADPILKERYFGLSGHEGNHGEDAKDYWWYVDSLPSHAFHCTRYAYPLRAFPYTDLVETNRARGRDEPEYELIDTGIFDRDDYVMVTSRWAKAGPRDICLTVELDNRADHAAVLHVLPTLWFRNTWSWDCPAPARPRLWADGGVIRGSHETLGDVTLRSEAGFGADCGRGVSTDASTGGVDALLFCENETNVRALYGTDTWVGRPAARYPKDGINDYVVHGAATVNPEQTGTKAAAHHIVTVPSGERRTLRIRLTGTPPAELSSATGARLATGGDPAAFRCDVDAVIDRRQAEADEFWRETLAGLDDERAHIARQALAGLLSSKQYYHYDVRRWRSGDPTSPPPPDGHADSRNSDWQHLAADDVILMPDAWEYPWFAAWDLAFQCMSLALIDPSLAKEQLLLLLDDRYLHPNGDISAYEWNFSDTNPPVQAWAALQIFTIDGGTDIDFLRRVMHRLLMNFTWWVNREDAEGNNVFEGGFLGLDNIGAFDRSSGLPTGSVYEQSDGTAWMAMYCLDMLRIALLLAEVDHTYDDLAVKFLLHFCTIAAAADSLGLWDEADSFYYDQVRQPDDTSLPVRIRSVVGLIPLAAVTTLDGPLLDAIPALRRQLGIVARSRPELLRAVHQDGPGSPMLLAMVDRDRAVRLLAAAGDSGEFLSDFGLRSLSARYRDRPATVTIDGVATTVDYEPGESRSGLFGGNSNWRGPIWFPINVLLISAMRRYHAGTDLTVEYPTGSGRRRRLSEIADDVSERLLRLFRRGDGGTRPCQARLPWQDDVLFHEYFHGDTGSGLGAGHQTGWTALIALLMFDLPG